MILNQVAQGGSPAISVVDTPDSGGGTVRTITASGTTIPTPASDISKLILNGVTQMDVTDTTATVSDVASGKVFTQVDGVKGTGTASGGDWSTNGIATSTEPNGDIVFNGTALGMMAFAGKPITSFVGPNVTSLGGNCFGMCSSLVSASFPVLELWDMFNFNNQNFGKLASLESLNIPNVKDVGPQTFTQMPMLTKVILPAIQTTRANSFNTNGSGITTIDIGKNLNKLSGYAFNGAATALVNVILRRDDAIVTADASNTLINNRVVNYYVPSDLIESYKVATNWSIRYSAGYANFIALENSIYESEDWYKDD